MHSGTDFRSTRTRLKKSFVNNELIRISKLTEMEQNSRCYIIQIEK